MENDSKNEASQGRHAAPSNDQTERLHVEYPTADERYGRGSASTGASASAGASASGAEQRAERPQRAEVDATKRMERTPASSSDKRGQRGAASSGYVSYAAGSSRGGKARGGRGGAAPTSGYVAASAGGKRRHPGKVIGITLLVVVLILVAVYVGVASYFQDHFYPNTVIGDVNVSLMSTDEATQALEDEIGDYTLSISGEDFELELSAEEASLDVDEAAVVADASADRDPWSWPVEVFEEHDESDMLVTATDGTGLEDSINAAVEDFNASAVQPTDATVAYNEDSATFEVSSEELGTALDAEGIVEIATEALMALETSVEVTDEQLLQPSVFADDERLTSAADTANTMIATDLSFTLNGEEVATLDGSQVIDWVSIDEEYNVTLDSDAASAWVQEVAADWETVGTERSWTRADGKECTVEGGDWGWSVDVDGLVSTVQDSLAAGSTEAIEIPFSSEGEVYTGVGERDWGERYCDIDLSEQHVYFYDENGDLVWESDCVTGTPDGERDTPTGVYSINWKSSPETLTGYDEDGEIEYESEVTYWMPFVGSSIGLHDATWQSEFGGTRYKDGYGSHGCVNLPLEEAGELYDIIETGDVVVVHW